MDTTDPACFSCGNATPRGLLTYEHGNADFIWSVHLCGKPVCTAKASVAMFTAYSEWQETCSTRQAASSSASSAPPECSSPAGDATAQPRGGSSPPSPSEPPMTS